jgi:hypothetical protein
VNATDLYTFTPEKNYSVKGTYSSELSEGASFHLILLKRKNKSEFRIKPVYISNSEDITEFEAIEMDRLPSIVSHHSNNNIISFLDFNKRGETISLLDFDLENTSSVKITDITLKGIQTIFRLEDRTILLNIDKKGEKISHKTFGTSQDIHLNTIDIPEDYKDTFKKLMKNGLEAINQNEYVDKASIHTNKIFLDNNILSYIIDDEKEKSTKSISIDLANPETFIEKEFSASKKLEKIKNYNTYVYNKQLFSIASNKNLLEVEVFDLVNGAKLKTFSASDVLSANNDVENMKEYAKSTSKKNMKSTITVNETKDGNLVMKLDRVDRAKYRYNYNWWGYHWMMHQNMMMQQHQMQQQQQMIQRMNNSIPNRFGPNPEVYNQFEATFKEALKTETEAIVLVFNKNLEILAEANTETKLPKIDRDKNLEKFKKESFMKNTTASFTDTKMTYVYLNRKTKVVHIETKPLLLTE